MDPAPIAEIAIPDTLDAVRVAGRPVVMRGLVRDWPLVKSADPLGWLGARTPDPAVRVIRRQGVEGGRFFYHPDDMRRFNFDTGEVAFSHLLEFLRRGAPGQTVYMGSTEVGELVPGSEADFALPLVPDGTPARLWLGNRTVVSTHHDHSENVACVVQGRRVFTLFPPEQVANLYPGPIEHTPAGPQLSMVDPDAPDLARFPRFAEAACHAMRAELGPGDAIYIPPLWWHHVRALTELNALVNFWWRDRASGLRDPMEAFVLSLLSVRELPRAEREAWRAMFDYFVFQTHGEPMAHLPFNDQGVLGDSSPARAEQIRQFLDGLLGETKEA